MALFSLDPSGKRCAIRAAANLRLHGQLPVAIEKSYFFLPDVLQGIGIPAGAKALWDGGVASTYKVPWSTYSETLFVYSLAKHRCDLDKFGRWRR
jgi:hypothetical protein